MKQSEIMTENESKEALMKVNNVNKSDSTPKREVKSENYERRKLIGRIWSILPVPLRSDFFILYFDTRDHQELKRRVKIVEDVLFDFLSPLADTLSRTERGISGPDTDRFGKGHLKASMDDFRSLYSYWSDSSIDWDNIRSEIIERILSVPAREQNAERYHGRGGAGQRLSKGSTSMDSINSQPVSPSSMIKETLILTSPRFDVPWGRRPNHRMPSKSMSVESEPFPGNLMKSEDGHQFYSPWQHKGISYLTYEEEDHEFRRPMRYFHNVGDHKHGRHEHHNVDSFNREFESTEKGAGAWTRRHRNTNSAPSFFYTSEGYQQREGTQRLRMMFKQKKKH